MGKDHVLNTAPDLVDVLAADSSGIDVLIYSGALDYICNWMGGRDWALDLEWPGKDQFNAAKNTTWTVDSETAGSYLNHDNFTFLKFNDAGHQVPQD